jgi:hypothetical protein
MQRNRERISDRGHKPEKEISEEHLGKFNPEGSRGLALIQRMCHSYSLTRESLVVLAQVFSAISGIAFHRDYTRRRTLVIKWFDDNFDRLQSLGSLFTLEAEPLHSRGDEIF